MGQVQILVEVTPCSCGKLLLLAHTLAAHRGVLKGLPAGSSFLVEFGESNMPFFPHISPSVPHSKNFSSSVLIPVTMRHLHFSTREFIVHSMLYMDKNGKKLGTSED